VTTWIENRKRHIQIQTRSHSRRSFASRWCYAPKNWTLNSAVFCSLQLFMWAQRNMLFHNLLIAADQKTRRNYIRAFYGIIWRYERQTSGNEIQKQWNCICEMTRNIFIKEKPSSGDGFMSMKIMQKTLLLMSVLHFLWQQRRDSLGMTIMGLG
jgi:hypothetical protein